MPVEPVRPKIAGTVEPLPNPKGDAFAKLPPNEQAIHMLEETGKARVFTPAEAKAYDAPFEEFMERTRDKRAAEEIVEQTEVDDYARYEKAKADYIRKHQTNMFRPIREPPKVRYNPSDMRVRCWSCKYPTNLDPYKGGRCENCGRSNFPDPTWDPIDVKVKRIPLPKPEEEVVFRKEQAVVFYTRETYKGYLRIFAYDEAKTTEAGSQITYAAELDAPYGTIKVGDKVLMEEYLDDKGFRHWTVSKRQG
jgi:hypothetical protein